MFDREMKIYQCALKDEEFEVLWNYRRLCKVKEDIIMEDIAKSENIYGILKALESESDKGVSDEIETLEEIFRQLGQLENGESLKTDLVDLIQLTRMDYFAKGMKLGARLSDLLLNSPCDGAGV